MIVVLVTVGSLLVLAVVTLPSMEVLAVDAAVVTIMVYLLCIILSCL